MKGRVAAMLERRGVLIGYITAVVTVSLVLQVVQLLTR